ncbi:hypothetical protein [Williamsoniiplasma lucivorax]|uniref:Lipoprotein n=1 Tax=Williamsoniiplasma lucivorax TaxID=209274 RepID=A0A2S5RFK0_9MOLU|nr:hypothetical protein [Williamsoniiplasma lucivorax]PPE05992.1 hypothetical protein ELUCI_v1c02830 [Williamsoniiplasma lucivorax]
MKKTLMILSGITIIPMLTSTVVACNEPQTSNKKTIDNLFVEIEHGMLLNAVQTLITKAIDAIEPRALFKNDYTIEGSEVTAEYEKIHVIATPKSKWLEGHAVIFVKKQDRRISISEWNIKLFGEMNQEEAIQEIEQWISNKVVGAKLARDYSILHLPKKLTEDDEIMIKAYEDSALLKDSFKITVLPPKKQN